LVLPVLPELLDDGLDLLYEPEGLLLFGAGLVPLMDPAVEEGLRLIVACGAGLLILPYA
jgi:hypothetical protein